MQLRYLIGCIKIFTLGNIVLKTHNKFYMFPSFPSFPSCPLPFLPPFHLTPFFPTPLFFPIRPFHPTVYSILSKPIPVLPYDFSLHFPILLLHSFLSLLLFIFSLLSFISLLSLFATLPFSLSLRSTPFFPSSGPVLSNGSEEANKHCL